MIWKDRIKQYPHRYTLTNVSGSTYDFTEVTGEVNEVGTPVNAENMNKLLQRDGDDLKDTVTTFSEAATEANILSTESTSTLFGKIKKWYTNKIGTLKSFAYNPATYITSTDTDGTIINNSANQDISGNKKFINTVYADKIRGRNILNLGLDSFSQTVLGVTVSYDKSTNIFTLNGTCTTAGDIAFKSINTTQLYANNTYTFSTSSISGAVIRLVKNIWETIYFRIGADANIKTETISANTYFNNLSIYATAGAYFNNVQFTLQLELGSTATPYTPYIGEFFPTYDKVIRTQAEFEALIASSTWFNAVSVAFIGQFTLSTANNSGVKIPATVKQIHGYNGAKITVTNFTYNATTAKGGLWYDTMPTTNDYSIRDLEVICTESSGTSSSAGAFYNCRIIKNCIGINNASGSGTSSAFGYCDYIINCKATITQTGAGGSRAYYRCNHIMNCIGYGDEAAFGYCDYINNAIGNATGGAGFDNCTNINNCNGTGGNYGFYNCTDISNCNGTGTGTTAYGFVNITRASNCSDGGSTLAMWGGTNKNISVETCRKTAVTADNATLNA